MMDPSFDPGAPRPLGADALGGERARSRAPQPTGSASFQALLEKLQAKAGELGREVERVERPADLAQAVDRAATSLHEALALEEKLLEAYRQALRAAGEAGQDPPAGTR